jgi:UDP-glucose 4-epimerase
VIQVFEKVSGQKLPYKIVDRREGDVVWLMPIRIKQIPFLDGKPDQLLKKR